MTKPTCTLPLCEKPLRSSGAAYCEMHYMRIRRHGDPSANHPRGFGPGEHHFKQIVGYSGVHMRLRTERGAPLACDNCGSQGQGKYHWALKPTARATALTSDQGPYSLDLSDYIRLCVPCHKVMDLAALREGSA